jgi:RND family efflux transporter MFP subunit
MASNRRTILIGAVAAIVVAAGVGAYALSRPATMPAAGELAPPLDFQAAQLARPQLRRMAFDLSLPGTVQALSQATVRSKLSAVVHKVTVREGDSVVPGQVLVELETAPLRALLAEREAGLASAKANLEQAKRTRDANAQLVERNFITQSAFDSADSTYQAQAANVAAAQAQLAQVQLQIDDAVVRAPIGGAIARRFVQDGEKVGMDAQLVSIVDLSRLEVQAQAAVSDVARVMPGAPAIVQIEGLSGQSFKGRVDRINPSADPGSRSIDLYVSFANERNIVRSGMFANVRLHLESDREATTLPLSAIQEDGGQPVAWAIKDGHLARRVVSVGRKDQQAQLAEVLGGVAMTDEVLATRFDNLKDGAPVRIVDMAAAPVAGGGPAPGAVH